MLAIQYQLQLSGRVGGALWAGAVLTPVTHPPSRRNADKMSQIVTKCYTSTPIIWPLECQKRKLFCILKCTWCFLRWSWLCLSLMIGNQFLTVLTVWIFLTNCTEPMIKSFLSSKVATQSNRHQLSLFNRKSPFDRELSYKFAFMRYFYPNLYAKIIKIQIRNPACID